MTQPPRTTAIITLLIAASLLAVPAFADDSAPSTIPHAFYGQIRDADGSNAPAGAIIVASAAGTSAGTITVTSAGRYGTDYKGGDKLIVWTPALRPGDNITFYIDGVRADESATYESGGITNLTLIASAPLPKERPKESTTRPVDGTGGEPVTVDAGNASVVLTAKGDFNGETLIFTLFTRPPDDQANPPGHGAINRFADITSSISNDNIQGVCVTLHYTDADVAGIDESSIRVYWWSAGNSTWVALPGGVDTAANFAWGYTDHFSTFGLFGVPPKPSPTGGGGGSPGGGAFVEPTSSITPAATETTPTPAGAVETTPATTGAPGGTAGAEAAEGEPGAGTAGGLPTVPIVAGIVVIAVAGYLLLRRR